MDEALASREADVPSPILPGVEVDGFELMFSGAPPPPTSDGDTVPHLPTDMPTTSGVTASATAPKAATSPASPRRTYGKRVSFSLDDEVREFTKTADEIAAERAVLDQAFEDMRRRWKQKTTGAGAGDDVAAGASTTVGGRHHDEDDDDDDDKALETFPDFREERLVTINRGKEMKPLGIDLSIKPAPAPETGTCVTVKGISRTGTVGTQQGSSPRGRLRVGDRLIKVWDSRLEDVEPGQFLGMLATTTIEMVVYNVADAEAKLAAFKHQKEVRAADLLDQRRQLEQMKLEQANDKLFQEKIEECMMQNWVNHFTDELAAMPPGPESSPPAALNRAEVHKIFRTVYLDRRLDQSAGPADLGLDRVEYFTPQEPVDLVPLGVSLFVRSNIKDGEIAGTFAVVADIHAGGLAAMSGRGRNQVWPDDRIISIQSRELVTVDPKELFTLLNCRRIELVLANVSQYEALMRSPDIIDDIGEVVDGVRAKLGAVTAKAKGMWSAFMKNSGAGTAGSTPGGEGDRLGVMDEQNPQKPDMASMYVPSPVIRGNSAITSGKRWCSVWECLPKRIQFKEARLAFNTADDGYSLGLLYARTAGVCPGLLMIQTSTGAAFGAYITDPLMLDAKQKTNASEYRGNGEFFVFQLSPTFRQYPWSGVLDGRPQDAPKMFLHCNHDRIAIGGGVVGGAGHAIEIDRDLHHGTTHSSTTFANEPLAATTEFECVGLEFWGFSENVDL